MREFTIENLSSGTSLQYSYARKLSSWRDMPLDPDSFFRIRQDQESENPPSIELTQWLDDVCRRIYGLPVLRGMLHVCPQLRRTEIIAYSDPSEITNFGHYSIEHKRIYLNRNTADIWTSNFLKEVEHGFPPYVGMITALHEFRHAYQDRQGCLDLSNRFFEQGGGVFYLANRRLLEADAVTFSIVGMADMLRQSDPLPMSRVRLFGGMPEASSWKAYLGTCDTIDRAHETGLAARRAFNCFLLEGNERNLKMIDEDVVTDIQKVLSICPEPTRSLSAIFKNAGLWQMFREHIKPLERMPSLENGYLLTYRNAYLNIIQVGLEGFLTGVRPETLSKMGYTP